MQRVLMLHYPFKTLCLFVLALGLLVARPDPGMSREKDLPGLQTMAGQMIMCGFRGLSLSSDDPLHQAIEQGLCGGVILFDRDVQLKSDTRNIRSPGQLRSLTRMLQDISPKPLLIAVDQEGGRVARLKPEFGFPPFPAAASLGQKGSVQATRQVGADMSRLLAGLGINLNLAPVVDVNTNPDNPAIGRLDRSFSAHPDRVAEQAAAFIQGQHESNILTSIKHFPGHGSAFNDSHLGLTDITATWEPQELLPYRRLTQSQTCDTIMTGHLVHRGIDPDHPASLSQAWIRDILRRDLGFDGVIITDDLQMRAITDHYSLEQTVRLALEAGADIILFGNNLRYDPRIAAKANALIKDLVEEGKISRQRIESSYERITRLKQKLSRHPACKLIPHTSTTH
ncbi:MAG: beta-N-acetylhexosaminidase [Desulfovermiculus sp.]